MLVAGTNAKRFIAYVAIFWNMAILTVTFKAKMFELINRKSRYDS